MNVSSWMMVHRKIEKNIARNLSRCFRHSLKSGNPTF